MLGEIDFPPTLGSGGPVPGPLSLSSSSSFPKICSSPATPPNTIFQDDPSLVIQGPLWFSFSCFLPVKF